MSAKQFYAAGFFDYGKAVWKLPPILQRGPMNRCVTVPTLPDRSKEMSNIDYSEYSANVAALMESSGQRAVPIKCDCGNYPTLGYEGPGGWGARCPCGKNARGTWYTPNRVMAAWNRCNTPAPDPRLAKLAELEAAADAVNGKVAELRREIEADR